MQVLYFSAPWCSPCKVFKPVVDEVSRNLGININYINVDYDAHLSQKYSVNAVPTIMIVNQSGDVLYRNSGVMSKDQLIKNLRSFL